MHFNVFDYNVNFIQSWLILQMLPSKESSLMWMKMLYRNVLFLRVERDYYLKLIWHYSLSNSKDIILKTAHFLYFAL